jgi:sodium/potassium-transporting ATPase subunit alpha
MGDKLAADVRIIQSREMKADNSPLTGETGYLFRTVECTHTYNPIETKNLAFCGTICTEGSGKGIVINIGDFNDVITVIMGKFNLLYELY